jgi:hypothetical protein
VERALSLEEGEALAVLGLRRGASASDVDAAHRRLAARAHPDRWLDAPAEDRDAAQSRFDEVNAAYRRLRGAQPAPRRRPQPTAPAPPPPPRPTAPPVSRAEAARTRAGDDDVRDPALSKGLVIGAAAVLSAVLLLAVVGLLSSTPDTSRQRRVLGPLAHRVWEAERTGAFGTVWDLGDDDLHALVGRDDFVAHLEACPPSPPPREVARIDKVGGGRWEVESTDPSGAPGLSYFRQTGDYTFEASVTDLDLVTFLEAPVASAPDQPWCHR